VVAILDNLRQPHLPCFQPILVLSRTEPPQALPTRNAIKDCCLRQADVLSFAALTDAGVQQAETIIVLRGAKADDEGVSRRSIMLSDYEVVTLCHLISGLRKDPNESDACKCFAMYDFGATQAVNIIGDNQASATETLGLEQNWGDVSQPRSLQDDVGQPETVISDLRRTCFAVATFCSAVCSVLKQTCSNEKTRETQKAASNKLLYHPRFASGQVLSPDFFGAMLGHICFFPATIEFVEALCMPAIRGQRNFPWQVVCPEEWVGRRFDELLKAWTYGEDGCGLAGCGPVLVLALYRSFNGRCPSGMPGYNVTLPEASTVLLAEDMVTVLGPDEFGKIMAQRGILRGAPDVGGNGEAGLVSPPEPKAEDANAQAGLVSPPEPKAEDASAQAGLAAPVESKAEEPPVQAGFNWSSYYGSR